MICICEDSVANLQSARNKIGHLVAFLSFPFLSFFPFLFPFHVARIFFSLVCVVLCCVGAHNARFALPLAPFRMAVISSSTGAARICAKSSFANVKKGTAAADSLELFESFDVGKDSELVDFCYLNDALYVLTSTKSKSKSKSDSNTSTFTVTVSLRRRAPSGELVTVHECAGVGKEEPEGERKEMVRQKVVIGNRKGRKNDKVKSGAGDTKKKRKCE